MGWAPHVASYGPLVLGIGNKAVTAANDELMQQPGAHRVRLACMEAAFDGYALACALTKRGGDGSGRSFSRGADSSRFEGRAVQAGPALETWPHAEVTAAVDAAGATMLFTGRRHFRH